MIQAKEYPEKNSETEKVQLKKNEKAAAGILLMPTTAFPLFIYATTCLNSLKLKEERLLSEVLHISSCAILSASGNDHCQNHT